jgi:hypothetical protein
MGHMAYGQFYLNRELITLVVLLLALIVISRIGFFKIIGGIFSVIGIFLVLIIAWWALKVLLFGVVVGSLALFLVGLVVLALIFG